MHAVVLVNANDDVRENLDAALSLRHLCALHSDTVDQAARR